MQPVALTIGGSDPSGGAGIQADLKTFHQHGAYGTSALTLVTVQNTQAVADVFLLAPDLVLAQLDAVLADLPPRAAKTGALGNAAIIQAVARRAPDLACPLVIDPVMISKHGAALMDSEAMVVLRDALLPYATVVTPNTHEAEALVGFPVDSLAAMEEAAHALVRLGARAALVKGGHAEGRATDVLLAEDRLIRLDADRLPAPHTHGTGCVFSAALTARLAGGDPLEQAARSAKRFVTEAIRTAAGLGHGVGPTNMHAAADPVA